MKITANYSENLPGEQYKTHRWAIELSREIPPNEDPGLATATLFKLASACVKAQVEQAKAMGNFTSNGITQNQVPQPSQTQNQTRFSNQAGPRLASEKQIKFLFQLGKKAGLSTEQISALPSQYFGKAELNQLTTQEASQLIDNLNTEHRKAA